MQCNCAEGLHFQCFSLYIVAASLLVHHGTNIYTCTLYILQSDGE